MDTNRPIQPVRAALRLIELSDDEMLRRIYELRVQAWRTFVNIDARHTQWKDEFETVARHWAFVENGEPVAAARLSIHMSMEEVPDASGYSHAFNQPPKPPIASLSRLFVMPKYRGLGLSRCLDEVRMAAARASGCRSVVVRTESGPKREAQLQSLGFLPVAVGPPDPDGPLVSGRPLLILLCDLSDDASRELRTPT
jgi:GNAT superfamily N-acetyltransferase